MVISSQQTQDRPVWKLWLPPTWLRLLVIVLVALGVVFRFTHLDQKPYWLDETFTSVQLSGYSQAEVIQQVADGQVRPIAALAQYQYPSPEKSVVHTVQELAKQEPQLTPVYFVLTRFWVQWLGNSIAVTRSLSAIFSLLALPAVYWLCLELFNSALTGWVAIALVSVSPFHVLYAQEARPVTLWVLFTLVLHASFLRASRRQTWQSWSIYGAMVAIGLYSYLLAAIVIVAQGFYLLLLEGWRLKQRFRSYLLAAIVGVSAFLPWVFYGLVNFQTQNQDRWVGATSLFNLIKGWMRGLSLFFIDFSLNETSPKIYWYPFLITLPVLLILVAYALYFLWCNTSRGIALFVITTTTLPALVLILPDLILGGQQSTAARYLIPTYVMLQLAVAHLFSANFPVVIRLPWEKIWKAGLAILLSAGIVSCLAFIQSPLWWNKAEGNINKHLAQIDNQSSQSLVVSDVFFVRFLSFSHALKPDVHFQLVTQPSIPEIPNGFSHLFLYSPSPSLKQKLGQTYAIEPVADSPQTIDPGTPSLWRLMKKG
jgi:uncharacterized membrane protein